MIMKKSLQEIWDELIKLNGEPPTVYSEQYYWVEY
jgi:hypothetical protein